MPRIETWKCAGCGKLKGEQNGWWMAGTLSSRTGSFLIHRFGKVKRGWESYCGSACVLKAVSTYIDAAHTAEPAAKEQSA